MESGYIYLQPKYVSKFQCDGAICPANCCKRDWRILIDEETFEKYKKLESAAHEITKHLEKNPEGAGYLIEQAEGGCPLMTENCLCSIQREHGEEFLSQTCLSYPRQLYNFGEIIERTLTPTCPLAAELIFKSSRLEFETVPLKLPEWAQGKLTVGATKVPEKILPCIIEIQLTAVSVLQERRLSIDERLIILGYYLFQVEEMTGRGDLGLIETLGKIYKSEEFFKNQMPQLISSVKFQVLEFVEIMFGIMNKIYSDEKILKTAGNGKYIEKFCKAYGMEIGDELNFQELAENYYDLKDIRKIFVEKYKVAFENYLVNDFFGGVYPYKIEGSIQQNYAVFVTVFKILEMTALAISALSRDEGQAESEIFKMVTDMSMDLNHNEEYLNALSESIKSKADITIFMRGLLER